jgi:hypothetical protein
VVCGAAAYVGASREDGPEGGTCAPTDGDGYGDEGDEGEGFSQLESIDANPSRRVRFVSHDPGAANIDVDESEVPDEE